MVMTNNGLLQFGWDEYEYIERENYSPIYVKQEEKCSTYILI